MWPRLVADGSNAVVVEQGLRQLDEVMVPLDVGAILAVRVIVVAGVVIVVVVILVLVIKK